MKLSGPSMQTVEDMKTFFQSRYLETLYLSDVSHLEKCSPGLTCTGALAHVQFHRRLPSHATS